MRRVEGKEAWDEGPVEAVGDVMEEPQAGHLGEHTVGCQ